MEDNLNEVQPEAQEEAGVLDEILADTGPDVPVGEEEEEWAPAEATFVTIRTAGGSVTVPVDPDHQTPEGVPGYTINEVLEEAGLTVSPSTQFWVDNNEVNRDFAVTAGAVITAIGQVKGG